jgi:hypothetical protein
LRGAGSSALRVCEELVGARDHHGPPHEATEQLEIAARPHAVGDVGADLESPRLENREDIFRAALDTPRCAALRLRRTQNLPQRRALDLVVLEHRFLPFLSGRALERSPEHIA